MKLKFPLEGLVGPADFGLGMRLPASGKRTAAPLQSARAAVQCRRCQLLRCRDGRRIYGPDPPDVIGPIHECYAHEDLNLDDKPRVGQVGSASS